jgi:hypothetical protein
LVYFRRKEAEMSWKVLTLALLLAAAFVLPGAAQEPARDLFDLLPQDARAKSAPAISAAMVDEGPILLHVEALAGEPRLPLPDGAVYDLVRTALERRGPESFAWRGKVLVPGRPDGSATLTVEDGQMAGTIFLPDALYQIRPAPDGGHRLIEIDPGRFPSVGARCRGRGPSDAPAGPALGRRFEHRLRQQPDRSAAPPRPRAGDPLYRIEQLQPGPQLAAHRPHGGRPAPHLGRGPGHATWATPAVSAI